MVRLKAPSNVHQEREFTVVFSMGKCNCDNCCRKKTVTAASRQDAAIKLQKMCTWAWVVRVE